MKSYDRKDTDKLYEMITEDTFYKVFHIYACIIFY